GIAVVARQKSWLANSQIFLKHGFKIVDTAPPDYELLVKKFNKSAPNPKFKNNWDKKLKKYDKGLTIILANQCPHTIRCADTIAETARKTYKQKPQIVEIKTYRQAQNAPTPYAAFAVIYNGQLLADHQISATRFKNIMNKILK
ncbi:MAG: GNAT family N-acetyltransferase, partial [Planctomycetes bacterium]|nr:GNAT family N-acetyltransferase [Planctomycetota bacterium]